MTVGNSSEVAAVGCWDDVGGGKTNCVVCLLFVVPIGTLVFAKN